MEHARLWWYIPPGCGEDWVIACRPKFQQLLASHEGKDFRARGHAVDAILAAPSESLVRKRGGRRRVAQTIRRRLRTVAAATRNGGRPPPSDTIHPSDPHPRDSTPSQVWATKLRRATEFGSRNKIRKAIQVLLSDTAPDSSPEAVAELRAKTPPSASPLPPCPHNAPSIIVDSEGVATLIRKEARALAASGSGWTAELLLPLIGDEVCLAGITLLVQLIANNSLDSHSRTLLTSSLLLGLPKPDRSLRPIAIGELFTKLASKYCYNIDSHTLPEKFEPIPRTITGGDRTRVPDSTSSH